MTAESRSHELTTERENEACILRHQCDLKERVSDLNHQAVLIKTEQDEVSIIYPILMTMFFLLFLAESLVVNICGGE